jgi:hypothetical protein
MLPSTAVALHKDTVALQVDDLFYPVFSTYWTDADFLGSRETPCTVRIFLPPLLDIH